MSLARIFIANSDWENDTIREISLWSNSIPIYILTQPQLAATNICLKESMKQSAFLLKSVENNIRVSLSILYQKMITVANDGDNL